MSKAIKITDETANELDRLRRPGQTYDGVIKELINIVLHRKANAPKDTEVTKGIK